ncbi:MAG: hypothetical protein A4E51_00910 [Methanosaeta sp. PtaU1.Bin055]|nr:MAG: hypothetical protein A4E51_00910 [Methanosaeta sp. PtaU1.Bin055]
MTSAAISRSLVTMAPRASWIIDLTTVFILRRARSDWSSSGSIRSWIRTLFTVSSRISGPISFWTIWWMSLFWSAVMWAAVTSIVLFPET